MQYAQFIASKRTQSRQHGFRPNELNGSLFDWQARAVEFAVRRGRAAMFEECGLGKTLQQLAWAEQIVRETNRPVVLHCPIGVRLQTIAEAEKFGIGVEVKSIDSQSDVVTGINVINYEKLHLIDPSAFAGVVLDESSILKSYTGKIKQALCDGYRQTPYRLACTATPAPNDHMELGNQSEFLGVLNSNDMLSRWFINDTMKAGGYRLKGHARDDFWRWVSEWAVCIGKPSDMGGSDDGFDLPALNVKRHWVDVEHNSGDLFSHRNVNATNVHEVKRESTEARMDRAAELGEHSSPVIYWVDTNYEADALVPRLPGNGVEVRGSENERAKEEKLNAFSNGDVDWIVTKPKIAGFGLNWQHCAHQVFAGLSFSFEAYYQAVRRSWRYGQKSPVQIDIVLAQSEQGIKSAIAKKERDHDLMRAGMRDAVTDALATDRGFGEHSAAKEIQLPTFLGAR